MTELRITAADYTAAQIYADFYSEEESYRLDAHKAIAREFAKHRIAARNAAFIEAAQIADVCAAEASDDSIAWAMGLSIALELRTLAKTND
jgi:hypothetical protein